MRRRRLAAVAQAGIEARRHQVLDLGRLLGLEVVPVAASLLRCTLDVSESLALHGLSPPCRKWPSISSFRRFWKENEGHGLLDPRIAERRVHQRSDPPQVLHLLSPQILTARSSPERMRTQVLR
jgi:hypothetical protein